MQKILGFEVTKVAVNSYRLTNDVGIDYSFTEEFLNDATKLFGELALIEAFTGILNKKLLPPLRIYKDNGKYKLIADAIIASNIP